MSENEPAGWITSILSGSQGKAMSSRGRGGPSLETIINYAIYTATACASVYLLSNLVNQLMDNPSASSALKREIGRKLKRPELEKMDFTAHEGKLFADVVAPEDIDVCFEDIGGMDAKLEELRDNIILPLEMWTVLKGKSTVLSCPTGLLLYGKPGTGKTMAAKAIAKEANATFISIKSSSLLEKYLGETEKTSLALFSLARKLAPSVIFIDEIDTLLGRRDSSDINKHFAQMQGMFLQQWDGLSSNATEVTAPVIVLGATNRPSDIDKAFLRRMPYSIEISLPDLTAREAILKKMLSKETVDSTVNLPMIANATIGCSGSDLREVVRLASMQRVKDLATSAKAALKNKAHTAQGSVHDQYAHAASLISLRPLTHADFEVSLRKKAHSSKSVNNFQQKLASEEEGESNLFEKVARQILLSSMEAAGNTGKSSNGVGEDEVISDPPNID